jgi:hypothetical protein
VASALGGERVDILIGGDTHVERLELRDGVVLINSGSPTLPHHLSTRLGTVGVLEITPGRLRADLLALGPSEGLRNPAHAHHLVVEGGAYAEGSVAGVTLSEADFRRPPAERLKHALHLRNTAHA